MSSQITLKALGLNFQPNQLQTPPGSLTEASNCNIRRDDVVEPRRGFQLYGTSFGSTTDRAKQLFSYKKTILRHYSNILQFDSDNLGNFVSFNFNTTYKFTVTSANATIGAVYTNNSNSFTINSTISSGTTLFTTGLTNSPPLASGTLTKVSGTGDATITFSTFLITKFEDVTEAQSGLRTKSIESNGNFYFTSSEGIRKISAVTSADFSTAPGYITKAGGVKAIDLTATLSIPLGQQSGFLPADSAVSYRTLWLTKDENNNLIQGTPSQPISIYNFQSTLLLQDYINLLGALDNLNQTGSIIKYGQFVKNYGITASSSASQLQTALLTSGAQIDYSIEYASDAAVTAAVPLQISTVTLDNSLNLTTVTFSGSPTLTNYFSIGDPIFLTSTSSLPNSTPINGFVLSNGNTKTFDSSSSSVVSTSHSTITITSHGFVSGQPVQLTPASGTLPTGLNTGTTYYIINTTPNTFQLSTSKGGAFVSITALGTDTTTSIFVIPTGTINGAQIITSIGSTTIQFSTTATGSVAVTSSKIISYKFETLNNSVAFGQTSSLANLVISIPPTNAQLAVLENSLQEYISTLQALPIGVINSTLQTQYISVLELTTTANVNLNITIPQDAQNPNYFLQVYRSDIAIATQSEALSSLVPDDEMALVYEAYPTAAEIAAKQMNVLDETPVAFEGANLYTNAFSGEGIAQANDIPPFALDINKFNGSVFYANTKTRQRQQLQLLPVNNLIADFNAGKKPTLLITNGTVTNKYTFQLGVQEVQQITSDSYANTTNHGYIILYSSNNSFRYFFRLNKTTPVGNPAGFISGTDQLIDIDISPYPTYTATQMAQLVSDKINIEIQDFTAIPITNTILVTNTSEGIVSSGSVNSLGGAWAIIVTVPGNGENPTTNSVLISSLTSAAQAIDATSRSLVRIINRNSNETIYAYYLSGADTVPGQMLLESRNINVPPFYLLTNDSNVGKSFSPDLSPGLITITNITNGVVTTSAPHGLTTGQQVVLLETGSFTGFDFSGLDTITAFTSTTFTLGSQTSSASTGVYILATSAIFSSDEEKKNRLYFSKADQPEAVPIVNYFDIGALDKAILRIIPLRDSLFVFKEDGLYRISGTQIPFVSTLFDGSCIVEASDSVALANNIIYCWTSQGISTATESGVKFNISRPIDTDILKKATSQYTNFKTATWGIGYESDNSYLLSTVVNTTDTEAQIMYRYSTITNTWTTYDKNVICGTVNATGDDKMYLGAGDTNYIEQERKNYNRTDYADRQFDITLAPNEYFGSSLQIPTTNIAVGDVITQDQYVTKFLFNELLQKLDSDPSTTVRNFVSTLTMNAGDNSHTDLVNLAARLSSFALGNSFRVFVVNPANATAGAVYTNNTFNFTVTDTIIGGTILNTINGSGDPVLSGTLTKISGTGDATITFTSWTSYNTLVGAGTDFVSLQSYYNAIINRLNIDPQFAYNNYTTINNDTLYEMIVTNVNTFTNTVTVTPTLDLLQGTLTIYKSINAELTYCPSTMGDPLNLKHFRESTVMFENKAFTNSTLSFASDLLPAFKDVPVPGDGNGIFGNGTFFGSSFFGGSSNSAPFRTYVTRDHQRCRYLVVKFSHNIARESFALFGITLTGETTSVRGYR